MPVFCIYDEAVAWKQDLNTVCVINESQRHGGERHLIGCEELLNQRILLW